MNVLHLWPSWCFDHRKIIASCFFTLSPYDIFDFLRIYKHVKENNSYRGLRTCSSLRDLHLLVTMKSPVNISSVQASLLFLKGRIKCLYNFTEQDGRRTERILKKLRNKSFTYGRKIIIIRTVSIGRNLNCDVKI